MLANIPRPARYGFALSLLVAIGSLGSSRSMASSEGPSVIDGASMFSSRAIRLANEQLAHIDRQYKVSMIVETVESLRGQGIDEVTLRKSEQLGHKGIYVLIAKQDHKAEVLASPRVLQEELGRPRLVEIRDTFLAEFRKNKIDDGLLKGVEAAEKALATIQPSVSKSSGGFLPSANGENSSSITSPLVLRQQVRLTLAGARKVLAGAEAKATRDGLKMNFAVTDDGGHLIAFERMDGARPASVASATAKAVSAATYRQSSGPLEGSTDVLSNLSLQNASGGKFTSMKGGLPIVVDGQVIGAIGVGGGTGEQDTEVAKAGIAAFLEGLQVQVQAKPEEPKTKPRDEVESRPKEGDTVTPSTTTTTKPVEAETTPK